MTRDLIAVSPPAAGAYSHSEKFFHLDDLPNILRAKVSLHSDRIGPNPALLAIRDI